MAGARLTHHEPQRRRHLADALRVLRALGAGYVVYGRKQHALPPFLSGVALIVFPYLVTGEPMVLLVGAAIAVVPFFWRN